MEMLEPPTILPSGSKLFLRRKGGTAEAEATKKTTNKKSLYSGGLLDVAAESRYVRINSRITIAGTSISPRDDTGKNVADNKWTAGVSLASIFSASGNTSAQHAVGDATRTVCG
jgi:hypothetical protein